MRKARSPRTRSIAQSWQECITKPKIARDRDQGAQIPEDGCSRLSDKSASSPEQEENDDGSVPEEHNILITPTNSKSKNTSKTPDSLTGRKILLFTPEEDQYLRMGLERHSFGNWTAILRDPDFHFQKGRTPNSVKSRGQKVKKVLN